MINTVSAWLDIISNTKEKIISLGAVGTIRTIFAYFLTKEAVEL
jgi:uncharacterized membrane protein